MGKKVPWKGQDFREVLLKDDDNLLFKRISIGKNSLYVSIQAGKYFFSTPRENADVYSYSGFEVAFFIKNNIITEYEKLNFIFNNFNRKNEFLSKNNNGFCFENVHISLIQDALLYLRKMPKIKI